MPNSWRICSRRILYQSLETAIHLISSTMMVLLVPCKILTVTSLVNCDICYIFNRSICSVYQMNIFYFRVNILILNNIFYVHLGCLKLYYFKIFILLGFGHFCFYLSILFKIFRFWGGGSVIGLHLYLT